MAFDGIVIANITHEMQALVGGRISKIAQPYKDELLLTVNTKDKMRRLLICANASLPLVYFVDENMPSPITAPNFCMLLRKHIGNGRIMSISQPSLERIIRIEIEHQDEMGDMSSKYLVIELMGKYSNIIFTDANDNIIDSIHRVPVSKSSLREVLPGRKYFIPDELKKSDTKSISLEEFISLCVNDTPGAKAIYSKLSGISPIMAEELCHRGRVDSDAPFGKKEATIIYEMLKDELTKVNCGSFKPNIIYKNGEPIEFSSTELSIYDSFDKKYFDSPSLMLRAYYEQKAQTARMKQKSADLKKIVDSALSREIKKLEFQEKQLADANGRDKYRKYGELLRANSYKLSDGDSEAVLEDYENDNKLVTITLDKNLTIQENANKFYNKYQKLRRTSEALAGLIEETRMSVLWLNEIKTSLMLAENEDDLAQIKSELHSAGYIKKPLKVQKGSKGTFIEPLHFVSSDGYDIYVGKNNIQNEYVTFELAGGNDFWFHVKGRPGSHVIVKSGDKNLPDRVYEEAAALAAYYSSANKGEKVEVDYTQRKNLKKPAGSHPGLVIYHTNYSLMATASLPSFKY